MLDIEGYDELNHSVFTIATFSERGTSSGSSPLHLNNAMRLLSPVDESANVPFSYRLANETLYKEVTNRSVHRFQLEDMMSTLKNRYLFNVTAIPCRPGFKFQRTRCVCEKQIEGVLWYDMSTLLCIFVVIASFRGSSEVRSQSLGACNYLTFLPRPFFID